MAVTGEAPAVDLGSPVPVGGPKPLHEEWVTSEGRNDRLGPAAPTRGREILWGLAAILAIVGAVVRAANGGRGTLGGLVRLTDLGIAIGFALFAAAVFGPYADAARNRTAPPTYRVHVRTWAVRIVPVAWLVMLVAYLFPAETGTAQASTGFGTAASGATSVPLGDLIRGLTFTQPYQRDALSGPIGHLWPVAAAVGFVLVAPVLARFLWPRPGAPSSPAGTDAGRTLLWGAGGLVVLASVYRIAMWRWAPNQPPLGMQLLPAHLDALAVGAVISGLAGRQAGDHQSSEPTHRGQKPEGDLFDRIGRARSGPMAVTIGVTVGAVAWLTATYGLDSPLYTERIGFRGVAQHLLIVLAAAAIALPVVCRARTRRSGSSASLTVGAASRFAYPAYAWSAVAIGRWVSAPAGAATAPARHPGGLGNVSLLSTLVWTLGVSTVLGAITWGLVTRPLQRRARRPIGWFTSGLWAVALISFGLRIWSFGTLNARNAGNGDPFFYHSQANMLADGVGFGEPFTWLSQGRFVPSAIHPPLFTLWLTPASMLGARGFLAQKTMAAIAGVAVVVVAALLARRLAGPRAGLIAAGLVALYPDLWIVDGTLWPEGLYTAFAGLALLGAYRWLDRPTFARAAVIGAAVGAAILTRGEAIFSLGFLCLPLAFLARKRVDRWLVHAAVMGAVALALLAPWTVRNLLSFDRPVLVSTNSEEVLYYANCPDSYQGPLIGYWSFSCQQRAREARVAKGLPADPPGDEAERAAGWGKLGREYALDHQDRWPAVVTARVLRVWDLQHADSTARALAFEGRPYVWSTRGLLAYRIILLPGLIGLVVLWRRRRQQSPAWPLVATLAMVTFTAAAVYGHIRFRTTGDLVLLVGAAIAVDALLIRWPRSIPSS